MSAQVTALVNARVLTDHGPQDGLAVLVRGDRIEAIVRADDARVTAAQRHDLTGGCCCRASSMCR